MLTTNLALIERAIAFACRRHRLDADDAEELASIVKLKLVDNDYAILRAYEERCGFATYISVVVQRIALDYRIHQWGKWHASADAKRLGALAVELEQLLVRDGRTLDEALTILTPKHAAVTRASLESMALRFPARAAKRRDVELAEAESVAVTTGNGVEEPVMAQDRRRTSERLSTIMSSVIARMPEEERLILQLRFEGSMTVAQIARALRLDQKLLYRRIEQRMRDLRAALENAGLASGDVLDLVGRDETILDFDLRNARPRPSIANDETVAAQPEGSQ
ncbi:MAG TPA: sigma-70 family RNA polymerase sigma factor [Thermoanaerobaculia bacterium]|nr:sigma-70 family RNA polymerase sigma factor [Thermoanaerobaculia bacterium]